MAALPAAAAFAMAAAGSPFLISSASQAGSSARFDS